MDPKTNQPKASTGMGSYSMDVISLIRRSYVYGHSPVGAALHRASRGRGPAEETQDDASAWWWCRKGIYRCFHLTRGAKSAWEHIGLPPWRDRVFLVL
jgi:hypothetical protein